MMVPRVLEIALPGLPPSPNASRRAFWGRDVELARKWRTDAYFVALDAARRSGFSDELPLRCVTVEYEFLLERVNRDLDGLVAGAKPILDGVVDARLVAGDGPKFVVGLSASWRRYSRPGVIVRIKEAP